MDNNEKIENMKELARQIQESGLKVEDIRNRYWMKNESNVAKILTKLIEVEDLLFELDDFNTTNDQDYDQIEDFMLQIGDLRSKFTEYVDENPKLIDVKIH